MLLFSLPNEALFILTSITSSFETVASGIDDLTAQRIVLSEFVL